MTATGTITHLLADGTGIDETPTVRWEPCVAFADAGPVADLPACATCGWLADDHRDAAGDDARDAIVVALPTRPELRRAS